jgi:SH3 domain
MSNYILRVPDESLSYVVRVLFPNMSIFYQAANEFFDLSTSAAVSYDQKQTQITQLLTSLNVPKRFSNTDELKTPPVLPRKSIEKRPQIVVALYDFAGQEAGDLSFKQGDKIEILERKDNVNDWWTGRMDGTTGQFPGISHFMQATTSRMSSTKVILINYASLW